MGAMDEREFARAVEDALCHLYDYPYLQTHPLAVLLARDHGAQPRGRALQRQLIDTIQALRPEPSVPFSSATWRSYRYLYLRYAQAQDPTQVAQELGVSLRQSQRSHQQALRAISSVLWNAHRPQCQEVRPGWPSPELIGDADQHPILGTPEDRATSDEPSAAPSDENQALKAELDRITAAHGQRVARITETLESASATVAPLGQSRGVALDVSTALTLPPVRIERALLRQALVNLLVLLIERAATTVQVSAAVVNQSVEIRLTAPSVRRSEGREDSGSKATADDLAALRAEEGFAVSERLLAMSRATLQVVPVPHGGITISIRAPTAWTKAVLVIEDNPDAAVLFERYLVEEPYEVLVARTGEEAMPLAHEKRPVVITLDLMMPTQDGWEVLQTLKNDPYTHDTPVIVCSVLRQRDLALLLGAADFLPKPVSRPSLIQALQRCLALPEAASPATRSDSGSAPRSGAPASE